MISRAIALVAPWECRRCGSSADGGALLVADSPGREIAPDEIAAARALDSEPSAMIDERVLRCPACGSREIEIPLEVLDTKRLR